LNNIRLSNEPMRIEKIDAHERLLEDLKEATGKGHTSKASTMPPGTTFGWPAENPRTEWKVNTD